MPGKSESLTVLFEGARRVFNRNRLTLMAILGFVTVFAGAQSVGLAAVWIALGLTCVLHISRDRRWLLFGILSAGVTLMAVSTLADPNQNFELSTFSACCIALIPLLAISLLAERRPQPFTA